MESDVQQLELQRDLRKLAEHAIPSSVLHGPQSCDLPETADFTFLVDVCFVVENLKFQCHKVRIFYVKGS